MSVPKAKRGQAKVDGMQWFLGGLYQSVQPPPQRVRPALQRPLQGRLVDGSGNGYLKAVGDYVHLNPVRSGLLARQQPLQAYPWNSYPLAGTQARALHAEGAGPTGRWDGLRRSTTGVRPSSGAAT